MKLYSGASRADEFRGGTSAGGVTGGVTGSELAEVCQQSHLSVMGRNTIHVYFALIVFHLHLVYP